MESQQPSACKEAVLEGLYLSCHHGSVLHSLLFLAQDGEIHVEPSKSAPPAEGSVLLGVHCLGQGRCRRGMPGGTSVPEGAGWWWHPSGFVVPALGLRFNPSLLCHPPALHFSGALVQQPTGSGLPGFYFIL